MKKKTVYISSYCSPIGEITLASDGKFLIGLWIDGQKYDRKNVEGCIWIKQKLPVFDVSKKWLDLYFEGKQPDFMPPLKLSGSEFRQLVSRIMLEIPYGHTMSYGEIASRAAAQMGKERMSAQAVGGAVGHNPIGLIVPCHRVIGSNGSLTGYAGGIEKKRWLLEHEQAHRSREVRY